jgi:hypothetical protein
LLVAALASGFAAMLFAIALGSSRSGGIGPMIPNRLRVGLRKTGIPPVITRPCSIDLWQLRSQSAISASPTHADMMARFEPEVPFRTE